MTSNTPGKNHFIVDFRPKFDFNLKKSPIFPLRMHSKSNSNAKKKKKTSLPKNTFFHLNCKILIRFCKLVLKGLIPKFQSFANIWHYFSNCGRFLLPTVH